MSSVAESVVMNCDDHEKTNGPGDETVKPHPLAVALNGNTVEATLPGFSWSMIKLSL
jgi:alpha-L-arabinofuranosidase